MNEQKITDKIISILLEAGYTPDEMPAVIEIARQKFIEIEHYHFKIASIIKIMLEVDVFSMKNRSRKNADAFAIFCWLINKHTYMTRISIGEKTNRDHSSVTAAIKRFDTLYMADKKFTEKVCAVTSTLDLD